MNTRIYKLLDIPDCLLPSQFQADPEELAKLSSRSLAIQEYKLSSRHLHTRESMVALLIEGGKRFLQLKGRTIELAIRLFDLYCYRYQQGWRVQGGILVKKQVRENPLEKKENGELILLTCSFTAAKYHEIYPPSLNDFIFIFNDRFRKHQVVLKEVEILALTDFNLAMPVLSTWYEALFGKNLPEWGIECYIRCYNQHFQEVAHAIRKVQLTVGSTLPKENQLIHKINYIQKTLKILNVNRVSSSKKL